MMAEKTPSTPGETEPVEQTCGGKYVTRVEDGIYDVTCEKCGASPACGPAVDVHWAAQVWRDRTCENPPSQT
jgi:hypothetical protein